jgi:iron complex outermembrane recepter protein
MKIILLPVWLLLIAQGVIGQVTGRITSAAGQPVAFANVLLLKAADTTLAKVTLTDDKGSFQLDNVLPGAYRLRLSSVGFQTWESSPFELNSSQLVKDFGTQVMQEKARELGQVVVRAEKPLLQQQAFGTVVNVESSVLTKGSSALQLLERSPGVVIDYRNNNIALNGKSGVTVMINGKVMRMPLDQVVTLLNGMSADNIEKIELMTTPPAKYDASGSAGMINIVLKQNRKAGTNGSVSLTAGYGWREKATGNLNLSHNTKKFDIHSTYTYTRDRSYNHLYGVGTQDFPLLGGEMYGLFWNTNKPLQNNHDASLGADWRINPTTTVGGGIQYSNLHISSTAFNQRDMTILPDSLLLFTGKIGLRNRWQSIVNSIYIERKIGEGDKLSMDVDYIHYKNVNPTQVNSVFINKNGDQAGTNNDTLFSPDQKGLASTTIQVGMAKADYQKRLSEKTKLETGIKGTYTKSASVSGIESLVNNEWVTRPESTNDLVMKESITAAYASVNTQLNAATSLTVGARYEYSHTRINNNVPGEKPIDRNLGSLFPSLFLQGRFSKNEEWQISYTRRISRPTYNDLASFVSYNDPMSVFTGNPMLRPSITNNLKFGYSYMRYSFSLLLSRDDRPIYRWQLTSSPSGDLMVFSPQNLDFQNNVSLQASLPWKVTEWWNMSYNVVGSWRHFRATHPKMPTEKKYLAYSANFAQTFTLPRMYSVEVSGWFNSSSYDGTVKVNSFGAVNAGIRKNLNNNKGTFQLSVSDVFSTIKYRAFYGTLSEEAFNGKSEVTYNPESRRSPIIKLTYSRSFGTGTTRSRKQGAGTQDEQDRIRKY